MLWSEEQLSVYAAAIDSIAGRLGHVAVKAYAGTGKSTVIAESVRRLVAAVPSVQIMVCAFNVRSRDDLIAKLAGIQGVWVCTYNQIGYAFIRAAFRRVSFNANKGYECANAACIDAKKMNRKRSGPDRDWVLRVKKLAGLAKHTMPETIEALALLALDRGLADTAHPANEIATITAQALDIAVADRTCVDYDDQVWMPAKYDLSSPWRFDAVIADEYQDTAPSELWLMQKMLKADTGRLVVVGDPKQCINTFKGADLSMFDRTVEQYSMTVMPLTQSWRCSVAVVEEAKQFVPDFRAADDADLGSVSRFAGERMSDDVSAGDLIVSRINAPLISCSLAIGRRRGIPTRIIGRDQSMLFATIERSRASTIHEFRSWIRTEQDREKAAIQENGDPKAYNETLDVLGTLDAIALECKAMSDVDDQIRKLFSKGDDDADGGGCVTLGTVHRLKGAEVKNKTNAVWLLGDTYKSGESEEEDNIQYVAITRAKNNLIWYGEPRRYDVRDRETPKLYAPQRLRDDAESTIIELDDVAPPIGRRRVTEQQQGPPVRDFGRQLDLPMDKEKDQS